MSRNNQKSMPIAWNEKMFFSNHDDDSIILLKFCLITSLLESGLENDIVLLLEISYNFITTSYFTSINLLELFDICDTFKLFVEFSLEFF